ncbi:hypothetical protein I79_014617 [Cricetulus griseus]|uniref:Uncharacterized protein n=1 Tax=Cricetulus griseus TaxID=10029 RepID=G3HUK5_CRIGR|nr:hypothetical protein I79_014617 [Cricetulus griseus]
MPSTRLGTIFSCHLCWPGVCIPVSSNSLAWLLTRQRGLDEKVCKCLEFFITEHVYSNIQEKIKPHPMVMSLISRY